MEAYLHQLSAEDQTPVLVADSALYNQRQLPKLAAVTTWITRVPGTLSAVHDLFIHIDGEDMLVLDEATRCAEVGSSYGEVKQRWLLVFHQPTQQRQQATLERRIAKEREQAERALWHLTNRDFDCEDAIHQALSAIQRSWKYHRAAIEIITQPRYRCPGRPTPDARREVWGLKGRIVEDETRIGETRARLGKYVLATNQLDVQPLPVPEWLAIYKAQTTSVERGFRFLKDPLFFAHSLFLKKPCRIMALLMIMGLSLLVSSLAERQLRQQLTAEHETIPDQTGKPMPTPILRRVFQMFEGIDVVWPEQQEQSMRLIVNPTDQHRHILRFFSHHVRKIYISPS